MVFLDIYVAEIPKEKDIGENVKFDRERESIVGGIDLAAIEHDGRRAELSSLRNAEVLCEKFFAWRLLEYACSEKFGKAPSELELERSESGKWLSPYFKLSLSHTSGAVAVAVSDKEVGVDIECETRDVPPRAKNFAERALTERELSAVLKMPVCERDSAVISLWTMKEALFKKVGGRSFVPRSIDTGVGVVCRSVELGGAYYALSVAADNFSALEIHKIEL